MRNKLGRLLPHAAILICNMYVVFWLIDRVNKAMNFIDNGLTKGLLLILGVISLVNARALLLPSRPRRRSMPVRQPVAGLETRRPGQARPGGQTARRPSAAYSRAPAARPAYRDARRRPDGWGYSGRFDDRGEGNRR